MTEEQEEPLELTAEDIAAIKESEEQLARGEGIDSEEVKRRIRQLYRRDGVRRSDEEVK